MLITLVGCSSIEPPRIVGVEVVPAWSQEQASQSMSGGEEYPDMIIARVSVDNPSAAVKLLSGRIRIGYGGKWVAMLTLDEKVKISARSGSVVELPLRLNIQRTAQTMQLRAALKQRRTEDVEVDWQVALRSRMIYVTREQEAKALDDIAGEQIEQVRDMLSGIFQE